MRRHQPSKEPAIAWVPEFAGPAELEILAKEILIAVFQIMAEEIMETVTGTAVMEMVETVAEELVNATAIISAWQVAEERLAHQIRIAKILHRTVIPIINALLTEAEEPALRMRIAPGKLVLPTVSVSLEEEEWHA